MWEITMFYTLTIKSLTIKEAKMEILILLNCDTTNWVQSGACCGKGPCCPGSGKSL